MHYRPPNAYQDVSKNKRLRYYHFWTVIRDSNYFSSLYSASDSLGRLAAACQFLQMSNTLWDRQYGNKLRHMFWDKLFHCVGPGLLIETIVWQCTWKRRRTVSSIRLSIDRYSGADKWQKVEESFKSWYKHHISHRCSLGTTLLKKYACHAKNQDGDNLFKMADTSGKEIIKLAKNVPCPICLIFMSLFVITVPRQLSALMRCTALKLGVTVANNKVYNFNPGTLCCRWNGKSSLLSDCSGMLTSTYAVSHWLD